MFIAFINDFFAGKTGQVLCHTFIHSLWQGAVAAIAAGLVLLCTRKSAARVRYNLLGTIFLAFFIVCVLTLALELKSVSHAAIIQSSLHQSTEYIVADHTAPPLLQSVIQLSNQYSSSILTVWLLLVLYKCSRLTVGLQSLYRLRTRKLQPSPHMWQQRFLRLRQKMAVPYPVQLMESFLVKVPVTIGFLKPVILLPVGLMNHLSLQEVESILIHELAHIKRRDFLVNLLQKLVEAIFFFNPAVLWMSSLLRNEREACCDDMVLNYSSDSNSYVNALISFHEYALKHQELALGIGGDKRELFHRVKRIIMGENKKLNLPEKILLLMGLVLLSAFTFFPPRKADCKNIIGKSITQFPGQMRLSSKEVNYGERRMTNTPLQLTRTSLQPKNGNDHFSQEQERDSSGMKFRGILSFEPMGESSIKFNLPSVNSSVANDTTITTSASETQPQEKLETGNSELKQEHGHCLFNYADGHNEMLFSITNTALKETILNTNTETGNYINDYNYIDNKKLDWDLKAPSKHKAGSKAGLNVGSNIGLHTGSSAGSSSESHIESQTESTIENDSEPKTKNDEQTREKPWQTKEKLWKIVPRGIQTPKPPPPLQFNDNTHTTNVDAQQGADNNKGKKKAGRRAGDDFETLMRK